jgi:hypothetical protein
MVVDELVGVPYSSVTIERHTRSVTCFSESELEWLEVLADAEDDPPVFRHDLVAGLRGLVEDEPSLHDLLAKVASLSTLGVIELMATIGLRQEMPALPEQREIEE